MSVYEENLWRDFIRLIKRNCDIEDDEDVDEIIDEIRNHVIDWYDDNSYYVKPEDILMDYTFCTPLEAHKYLALFSD